MPYVHCPSCEYSRVQDPALLAPRFCPRCRMRNREVRLETVKQLPRLSVADVFQPQIPSRGRSSEGVSAL